MKKRKTGMPIEREKPQLYPISLICPTCGRFGEVKVSDREWPRCDNCECEMRRLKEEKEKNAQWARDYWRYFNVLTPKEIESMVALIRKT